MASNVSISGNGQEVITIATTFENLKEDKKYSVTLYIHYNSGFVLHSQVVNISEL